MKHCIHFDMLLKQVLKEKKWFTTNHGKQPLDYLINFIIKFLYVNVFVRKLYKVIEKYFFGFFFIYHHHNYNSQY